MTLQERVEQLVQKHGGLRKAGRVVQIDPGYLSRIGTGEKARPSATILRRLGLRRVTAYELLQSAAATKEK